MRQSKEPEVVEHACPKAGTINNPDIFVMHCVCRVWRSDWETQIKFATTRIFVEALTDLRFEQKYGANILHNQD